MVKAPKLPDYRLDMTLVVLEEFSRKISRMDPPEVPYDLVPSTRGYSMNLPMLDDNHCLANFERADLLVLTSRLTQVLAILNRFIREWEVKLEEAGEILASYEFMPGDYAAMDNVRTIAQRVDEGLFVASTTLHPQVLGDRHRGPSSLAGLIGGIAGLVGGVLAMVVLCRSC